MKRYSHHGLTKLFKKYMKVKDPTKAHAVLSASGSERWLGCPGSVRLSQGIPNVDNAWGIRGTNTHTLIQFILENYPGWKELLAKTQANTFKKFIAYDEAMLGNALTAVSYIKKEEKRLANLGGAKPELYIEEKVELDGVGFGTADIILYQPFGILHVMDYKNGVSVVEAEENTQGLYYAHAVADRCDWKFTELWITIIQPNADHKAGPVRTWKTTPERLAKEGRRFLKGAHATKKKNAPLKMDSKWCWFCPARPKCPLHQKKAHEKMAEHFRMNAPGQMRLGKNFTDNF